MVARITSPASLKRALNYNEKKVQQEKAECIYAGNYLKEAADMNFYEKLNRFENLASLNERTKKTGTLHISLNFHPSETFSKEKLIAIAGTYMEKIGFWDQPYLVYRHSDAGHPHIHIITTTIQPDGKRINTFNIGRNQSEKARKEIEEHYGMVRASGIKETIKEITQPVQRVQYGKSETRRSIINVLDTVISQYKYTSLAELNAVLKQYNIIADRGRVDGRIYRTKGLLYKLMDQKGNKIGVPVKASSIYSKPTLKNLEIKFSENELLRKPDKKKLVAAIDWALLKRPVSLMALATQLNNDRVQMLLRQNEKGLIYGITFIDHRTKSVFNGSDLGKQYSAAALQQRIGAPVILPLYKQINRHTAPKGITARQPLHEKEITKAGHGAPWFPEHLLQPEKYNPPLPFGWIKKKKRRKKSG